MYHSLDYNFSQVFGPLIYGFLFSSGCLPFATIFFGILLRFSSRVKAGKVRVFDIETRTMVWVFCLNIYLSLFIAFFASFFDSRDFQSLAMFSSFTSIIILIPIFSYYNYKILKLKLHLKK